MNNNCVENYLKVSLHAPMKYCAPLRAFDIESPEKSKLTQWNWSNEMELHIRKLRKRYRRDDIVTIRNIHSMRQTALWHSIPRAQCTHLIMLEFRLQLKLVIILFLHFLFCFCGRKKNSISDFFLELSYIFRTCIISRGVFHTRKPNCKVRCWFIALVNLNTAHKKNTCIHTVAAVVVVVAATPSPHVLQAQKYKIGLTFA